MKSDLACLLRGRRKNMGVRACASEIGISPATLTRIALTSSKWIKDVAEDALNDREKKKK